MYLFILFACFKFGFYSFIFNKYHFSLVYFCYFVLCMCIHIYVYILHSVGLTLRSYPRTTFCLLTTCEQGLYISHTSWLLLPWQASPPAKVRSDAAHPMISTPHRLRKSEIPMPKSVSSAVMHHCHHRPALPFRDWHPFTKPVLILSKEISSTFEPRGYAVLYPISRSGT